MDWLNGSSGARLLPGAFCSFFRARLDLRQTYADRPFERVTGRCAQEPGLNQIQVLQLLI